MRSFYGSGTANVLLGFGLAVFYFAIKGIVSLDKLSFSLPEDKKITKLLGHEAIAINASEKNIDANNLKTGEKLKVPFDSLIIGTGASPFIPPVKGAKEALGRGVFVLHDLESARKIIEQAGKAKKAVVVGAGPIGLEITVALRTKGLDVTVVEMLAYAFPRALDKDMAKMVERRVEEEGIRLIMNRSVSSVNGLPVSSVNVGEEIIETDMAYCPMVAENYDVLNKAADFAVRRLEKSK
jgi:NADH oxidase (H2O2-forming)